MVQHLEAIALNERSPLSFFQSNQSSTLPNSPVGDPKRGSPVKVYL
ncbi:hypothetical protein [Oscillatoria acuminata]|nr:hypothetical protein [Oscillatoria acuminata]